MILSVLICCANKEYLIFHMVTDVFQKIEGCSSEDCSPVQFFHKNDQNLLNEKNFSSAFSQGPL